MKHRLVVAACAALALAASGTAAAQQRSKDCPPPSASPGTDPRAAAPDRISGQVVDVDRKNNVVTMRLENGSTQQFQASPETIADVKVGDRIEAKKRTPDC